MFYGGLLQHINDYLNVFWWHNIYILDFSYTSNYRLPGYWHVRIKRPCGSGLHCRPLQQELGRGSQILCFFAQAPSRLCKPPASTVFPFWTPLIDTSNFRGEANVSNERKARIRTMVRWGTILRQCCSNIEGKAFCTSL